MCKRPLIPRLHVDPHWTKKVFLFVVVVFHPHTLLLVLPHSGTSFICSERNRQAATYHHVSLAIALCAIAVNSIAEHARGPLKLVSKAHGNLSDWCIGCNGHHKGMAVKGSETFRVVDHLESEKVLYPGDSLGAVGWLLHIYLGRVAAL